MAALDDIWDRPAVARDAPYEQWGVEDARITYLEDEKRYAITYTGYSRDGPRVCLITTDDLLSPTSYRRHGPRIAGENKNCVIFPKKVDGKYVILHRPMPRMVCIKVSSLEKKEWPANGVAIVGPQPNTWRSSGLAPVPRRQNRIGWLLPFHGATAIEEGTSTRWEVRARSEETEKVCRLRRAALSPEAPYEIERNAIPQVDMANFKTGVRVVFPQGLVERGDDLLVYYGAADVSIAGARVNKGELLASLEEAIEQKKGGVPL